MRKVAICSFVAMALFAGLLQWCGPDLPMIDAGATDAIYDEQTVQMSDSPLDQNTPCVHPGVTMECRDGWCRIPAGCYRMGSPPDEWGRGFNTEDIIEVTLTRPFIIQQFELTQEQWTSLGLPNKAGWFDGGPGNSFGDCVSGDCPASTMTWYEAAQFANALSSKDGRPTCYQLGSCLKDDAGAFVCGSVAVSAKSVYDCSGYRLPTEAEWEYAARAGTTSAFYNGPITPFAVQGDCNYDKNLDEIAWYCWNSDASITHPVGTKKTNGWGLYDMAGNAYEYTNDPFHGRYTRSQVDPWQLMPSPSDPVVRGGAAHLWASLARSADRNYGPCCVGQQAAHTYGFRLVRTLELNENWNVPVLPIPRRDAGPDASND